MSVTQIHQNIDHWPERVDMAAAFRWSERLNMHESVAKTYPEQDVRHLAELKAILDSEGLDYAS